MHGCGVWFSEDRFRYEGVWTEGKKNGKFKVYTPKGDLVFEGSFVDDLCVFRAGIFLIPLIAVKYGLPT